MNKPYALKRLQNLMALCSIGLASYPGLSPSPGNSLRPVHHHRISHKAVATTTQATPPNRALEVPWISVKVTSYCWQEPDHAPFGRHNCMGGDLTQQVQGFPQCAADLTFYPLGSILYIKTDHGAEIRIVTDCGKAVRGPHHVDLHFDSLPEMKTRGTRKALILVIRWGWNGFPSYKVNSHD